MPAPRTDHEAAVLNGQLTTELCGLIGRVAQLIPPDDHQELLARVQEYVPKWAKELAVAEPPGETVIALVNALWPNRDPPVEWWGTPLGQVVVRSVGHPAAGCVSHSIAAEMLGVVRSRIGSMANSGALKRRPGGSITSASVSAEARRRYRAQAGNPNEDGCAPTTPHQGTEKKMIKSIEAAQGSLVIVPASCLAYDATIVVDPHSTVIIVRGEDNVLEVLAAARRLVTEMPVPASYYMPAVVEPC